MTEPRWNRVVLKLSGGAFAPLAERFFRALSSKRRSIAALFDHECADGACHVSRGPRRRAGGG